MSVDFLQILTRYLIGVCGKGRKMWNVEFHRKISRHNSSHNTNVFLQEPSALLWLVSNKNSALLLITQTLCKGLLLSAVEAQNFLKSVTVQVWRVRKQAGIITYYQCESLYQLHQLFSSPLKAVLSHHDVLRVCWWKVQESFSWKETWPGSAVLQDEIQNSANMLAGTNCVSTIQRSLWFTTIYSNPYNNQICSS